MTGRRVIDTIAAMVDWPATPDARYALLGHTHAIYALLSHAHAGEDITSGTVADARIAASLTGKTLVTPTIASFVNAQHNHADEAGGGTVSGGGGTPGGATTQVQVNVAGAFGAYSNFTYDGSILTAPIAKIPVVRALRSCHRQSARPSNSIRSRPVRTGNRNRAKAIHPSDIGHL